MSVLEVEAPQIGYRDFFTFSEMQAFSIMLRAGLVPNAFCTTSKINIHDIADQLILIAEKIKAERATAAMLR